MLPRNYPTELPPCLLLDDLKRIYDVFYHEPVRTRLCVP